MKFISLAPMLTTRDIPETRRWYETILGFQSESDSEQTWCRLIRDDARLLFVLGDPSKAVQSVVVDDVMALYDAIKDKCSVLWGPEHNPHYIPHRLEFVVRDNNGYLLNFGQDVE